MEDRGRGGIGGGSGGGGEQEGGGRFYIDLNIIRKRPHQ